LINDFFYNGHLEKDQPHSVENFAQQIRYLK